jgi:putative membrane protein insertion efficiency factor
MGALFRAYRLAIAPLLGPACRYEPSCSHYAEEAIERWGLVHGVFLAAWRILRCHPFACGGLDPVPNRMMNKPRNTAGDL